MVLMSLRSRSHVKASMVLLRADQLLIHNYIYLYIYLIRSLINIKGSNSGPTACVFDVLAN